MWTLDTPKPEVPDKLDTPKPEVPDINQVYIEMQLKFQVTVGNPITRNVLTFDY